MARELDLSPVRDLLERFQIGVDDLFFALHLGAERIAQNPAHPPSTRQHWRQVSEACRQLWQDFGPGGERLNPERKRT